MCGDESPDFDANYSDECCGPINIDRVFEQSHRRPVEQPDFSDTNYFYLLLQEAEAAMYKVQIERGLSLYGRAYGLAKEMEALGADACFGVMFHLHYFNFDLRAYWMCTEITQMAFESKDVSLLRDIWRILPEIGFPGDDVNELALILRDNIENQYPEVMDFGNKSRRF